MQFCFLFPHTFILTSCTRCCCLQFVLISYIGGHAGSLTSAKGPQNIFTSFCISLLSDLIRHGFFSAVKQQNALLNPVLSLLNGTTDQVCSRLGWYACRIPVVQKTRQQQLTCLSIHTKRWLLSCAICTRFVSPWFIRNIVARLHRLMLKLIITLFPPD